MLGASHGQTMVRNCFLRGSVLLYVLVRSLLSGTPAKCAVNVTLMIRNSREMIAEHLVGSYLPVKGKGGCRCN